MVDSESVGVRHGGRVPAGVAPVPGDARSGRRQCRPKLHVFRANDAPRDSDPPGTRDVLSGLPATGELCTFVLRRLTLDVLIR